MVIQTAVLESNLTSVERIEEYCNTPKEAEWEIENQKPSKDWPSEGKISFKNYSVRYRENLDYALKKIDCEIKKGEKVF